MESERDFSARASLVTDSCLQPGDCDDFWDAVNPDADEPCNQRDDDCNGIIDDDAEEVIHYPDSDRDGFYSRDERDSGDEFFGCSEPGGRWASRPGDCAPDDENETPTPKKYVTSWTTTVMATSTSAHARNAERDGVVETRRPAMSKTVFQAHLKWKPATSLTTTAMASPTKTPAQRVRAASSSSAPTMAAVLDRGRPHQSSGRRWWMLGERGSRWRAAVVSLLAGAPGESTPTNARLSGFPSSF